MVTDIQPNGLTITEAKRLRQQAGELLARLIADREQSEKRFADAGKRDPMKFITGRTALENAIASTRDMIANMDSLLNRLEGELDEIGGVEVKPAMNGRRHKLAPAAVAARPVVVSAGANGAPISAFKSVTMSGRP